MKKNLPLLILFLVVAAVIAGYLGYNSIPKKDAPPAVRDVKMPPAQIVGDDSSSGKQAKKEETQKEVSESIKKSDVPEVDPKKNEMMVWGELKAVDIDKRILTIDQQMDDNSVKISPNVPVHKDAIVRTKSGVIPLSQLKTGDTVGIILSKDGQARAVLVNY